MITAEQARKIMDNSEKAFHRKLRTIENEITAAAKKGRSEIIVYEWNQEQLSKIMTVLIEKGFTCRHDDEREININWEKTTNQ